MYLELIPSIGEIKGITTMSAFFVTFRLYRSAWFFCKSERPYKLIFLTISFIDILSKTPGLDTSDILLERYGLILFLVIHSFACIFFLVACFVIILSPK